MKLFVGKIERGTSHPEYAKFSLAMDELAAKHPDFGGTKDGAIFKHHTDLVTVTALVTSNINKPSDVSISEVTRETLKVEHIGYVEIVENLFLPHDKYPAIE